MSDLEKISTALEEYSKTGLKASSLFGAASDLIKLLSGAPEDKKKLLTGDPIADKAILRAAGVEEVIKARWNMDPEGVLEFIQLLLTAGTALEPMFKKA